MSAAIHQLAASADKAQIRRRMGRTKKLEAAISLNGPFLVTRERERKATFMVAIELPENTVPSRG